MTLGCIWLPSPYILAPISQVCHISNKSTFLVIYLNHADTTGFTCNLRAHPTPCYYNEAVENNLKDTLFLEILVAWKLHKSCFASSRPLIMVFGPLSYSHALKCKHILDNSELAAEGWALGIKP